MPPALGKCNVWYGTSLLDIGYASSEEIDPTDSVATFLDGVHINIEKLQACWPLLSEI